MESGSCTAPSRAQNGPSLCLAGAELLLWHALENAKVLKANVAISVTDGIGRVLCCVRMDGARAGIELSSCKARTAAQLRVSTRALQALVAAEQSRHLATDEICAVSGGVPVTTDDGTIGAIGVSGASERIDHDIALHAVMVLIEELSDCAELAHYSCDPNRPARATELQR